MPNSSQGIAQTGTCNLCVIFGFVSVLAVILFVGIGPNISQKYGSRDFAQGMRRNVEGGTCNGILWTSDKDEHAGRHKSRGVGLSSFAHAAHACA